MDIEPNKWRDFVLERTWATKLPSNTGIIKTMHFLALSIGFAGLLYNVSREASRFAEDVANPTSIKQEISHLPIQVSSVVLLMNLLLFHGFKKNLKDFKFSAENLPYDDRTYEAMIKASVVILANNKELAFKVIDDVAKKATKKLKKSDKFDHVETIVLLQALLYIKEDVARSAAKLKELPNSAESLEFSEAFFNQAMRSLVNSAAKFNQSHGWETASRIRSDTLKRQATGESVADSYMAAATEHITKEAKILLMRLRGETGLDIGVRR